jgi:excisionase family DNA binding protein
MRPAVTRPLTLREVAELCGVTRATLRSWVRAGRFPPPLKVGIRKKLWSPADVERALHGPTQGVRSKR